MAEDDVIDLTGGKSPAAAAAAAAAAPKKPTTTSKRRRHQAAPAQHAPAPAPAPTRTTGRKARLSVIVLGEEDGLTQELEATREALVAASGWFERCLQDSWREGQTGAIDVTVDSWEGACVVVESAFNN
jgi:hypothetical protein